METKSRVTEISELAHPSVLLPLLECPVCNEVPLPPILNCKTGHTLCSPCRHKLTHCPMCKADFSTSRNFSLEAIILQSKHKCGYWKNGCNAVLLGDRLDHHMKFCQFREPTALCHLGNYTHCSHAKTPLKLSQYLLHLKEVHMMLPTLSNSAKEGKVIFESNVSPDAKDTFWLGDYITCDSNSFVIRQFIKEGIVYFSMAIIADEKLAKLYYVRVQISSEIKKAHTASFCISVHSIRTPEEVVLEEYCGALPLSYLNHHATLVQGSRKKKMTFHTEYSIYGGTLKIGI